MDFTEIHKLLKLDQPGEVEHTSPTPADLPVFHASPSHAAEAVVIPHNLVSEEQLQKATSWIKNLFIYPFIFFLAFGFFYVVLNFSSLLAQVQGMFIKPQDEQILGSNLTEYYKWINNYYYAVGDKKLLDPNNDIDKDGLSNLDEFNIRTNPIVADSDSDGFSDGIEVIDGYNPWGSGSLTAQQKELAKSLDLTVISNRIGYNVSTSSGLVAGAQTTNFDLNTPGRLSIPRLNMQVPLIWSKDPADFETDLTKGVIHYPGTSLPGQQGVIYVSGHSSDYIWKHDPMANIFTKINYLKPGDDIFIDIYGTDGKVYNFRYQVTGNHTYKPDDQSQFIDNSANILNLSTCWPIGTQRDRLVVRAVQKGL